MKTKAFFDEDTYTLTFVVWDEQTKDAVVIDPVLDYHPIGSKTGLDSLKKVDGFLRAENLTLKNVLETHAHADHLTGAQWLKREHGAGVVIGEKIRVVQETFKGVFDLPSLPTDGSQFDRLVKDGETLAAGSVNVGVIATPGHTPACVTYQIGDSIFTGDALFMDDYGTGRCDFPMGSASDLYDSIQKLYALPDATRVFVGHDYQPGGREVKWETTIGASKKNNPQLDAETAKGDFVAMREARDKTLAAPRLLFQSVQVNIDAGQLPKPSDNGVRLMHLPLNLFSPTDDVGVPQKK